MSASAPMMPPVMSSSSVEQPPGYEWFQQLEASKSAKNKIVEQNHLATENEASRTRISYGNQVRTEKVGFANRDAIERNALENRSAVHRNGLANITATQSKATEDRAATLSAAAETRAHAWADFKTYLVGQRDQEVAMTKDRNLTTTTTKEEALRRQEYEFCATEKIRANAGDAGLRDAQNAWKLKNQVTMQHEKLGEHFIMDASALSLEQANLRYEQEKDNLRLGILATKYHGDKNRRMANYRAETDSRFAQAAAAATMYAAAAKADQEKHSGQFLVDAANAKAALQLQAAYNKAHIARKAAECCCDDISAVNQTSIATNQLAYATDISRVRDQAAAAAAEALVYSVRTC